MRRCATSSRSSPNPPSITRSEIKVLVLDSVMKSVYAQSAASGTALQSISMYAAERAAPLSARLHQMGAPKRDWTYFIESCHVSSSSTIDKHSTLV